MVNTYLASPVAEYMMSRIDDSNDTNEAARKVITYNLAALVRTV